MPKKLYTMSHEQSDQEAVPENPEDGLSPENLRGVIEDLSNHFPPPRLGTELVLLEVSPHRAHAYWNIEVEDFRAARKLTGMEQAPLVIRLFDVTDGTPPERAITAFDVEIQGLQGHWYLDLWKDGRTHVADLGFRDPEGRLVRLARSNAVSTPSSVESPAYHTEALDTRAPENLRVTDLVLDPNLSPENTDVETGVSLESVEVAEVRAVVEQGGDAPEQSPDGWPSAETLERLVPGGAVSPEPVAPAPEAPAAGTPPVQAAPSTPPPSRVPDSSPMPLDHYVSLSSYEHGRRAVALEISVELHIHGRAKPGTELTLYGQPVPLRPDGSFTIRKPLPQGAVVLPLLAVDPPSPASQG